MLLGVVARSFFFFDFRPVRWEAFLDSIVRRSIVVAGIVVSPLRIRINLPFCFEGAWIIPENRLDGLVDVFCRKAFHASSCCSGSEWQSLDFFHFVFGHDNRRLKRLRCCLLVRTIQRELERTRHLSDSKELCQAGSECQEEMLVDGVGKLGMSLELGIFGHVPWRVCRGQNSTDDQAVYKQGEAKKSIWGWVLENLVARWKLTL